MVLLEAHSPQYWVHVRPCTLSCRLQYVLGKQSELKNAEAFFGALEFWSLRSQHSKTLKSLIENVLQKDAEAKWLIPTDVF